MKAFMKRRPHSLFVIFILIGFTHTAFAADFPPREKNPIQPVTSEEALAQEMQPKENITPESAKTGRIAETSISEITITVLFGSDKSGSKSYKANYRVIETGKDSAKKEAPEIKVVYKNKADAGKFAVSEVKIKSSSSGTYKITASFTELQDGTQKTEPKITWLD